MNKLDRALCLLLISSFVGLPAQAIEADKKKDERSSKTRKYSEKELVKEKDRLLSKKSDLMVKRNALLKDRNVVARKVLAIEKNLAALSASNSAKMKRQVSNQLVKDEVKLKIQLVNIDSVIAQLDKQRLEIDRTLYNLEVDSFKSNYEKVLSDSSKLIASQSKKSSKSTKTSSMEEAVLTKIEPGVIKYWGEKRLKLNDQVLKARKNRLDLWKKELSSHKKFLEMKQADFATKRKRLAQRKVELKNYFSLRNSRQQMNHELIRVESESWQASRRMRYELSSLYRRIAYLKRIQEKRGSSDVQFSLLEPAPRKGSKAKNNLKVAEFTLGVEYDDLYNWATRIVSVVEGTNAKESKLKVGDEIVFVDDIPVIGSERGFKSLLRGPKDKEVNLTILRDGVLSQVSTKLDYKPEEVSHPSIIKQIKDAKSSNDTKQLVKALLAEVDYVHNFSSNKKVADPTADELIETLDKSKDLPASLKLKAYVACSSHYLTRMGDCLAIAKRNKSASEDVSESAGFLNKADSAAQKVIEISEKSEAIEFDDCWRMMSLVKEYRKHFDFKQIGTSETLKTLSDRLVTLAKKKAPKSRYQAATILNRLSQVYELSLKDYKTASQVLSSALEQYLYVVPPEAKELTELRLVLARNYNKSGNTSSSKTTLEDRLATLKSINSYSRKAEETGMYDYVLTLKELGKIYDSEGDYQKTYETANTIIDTYDRLDGIEDETYNKSLYLAGKSLLNLGKSKKAIPLLTEAYDRISLDDRVDCLSDLATCYQKTGKDKEARVLCLVVKNELLKQISKPSSAKSLKQLGDRAVRVSLVLDQIGDSKNAVSLFDTAIISYTNAIESISGASEDGKTEELLKEFVAHLSRKLKMFNDVLENAGRVERAKNLTEFTSELDSKMASSSKFETDWLVRLP